MAIKKHPYELSIWIERLNGSNSKIEEKGSIIGAHDMTFPGKATNIVLTRYLKGTNTLSFQMPDKYFDSMRGEFVHNEFIDVLAAETKIKLFYKDRWFEFFIKRVSEKKQFKSIMKTFTCSDAFIDELSRNGYGITFSTDLYNNVEEAGTFTTEVLEDSIWTYHPEHNWGDFTEFKEEKLFKIPVSQFKYLSGYKLNFDVDYDSLPPEVKDILISNVYTGEERVPEMSDDLARGAFWDQYTGDTDNRLNPLTRDYVENIPNDGYIYVPYSCLNFCYGSGKGPDDEPELKYDRAAAEIALTNSENELIIAPDSVDPRTLIQFIAFPANTPLEIDDAGVIVNKDYSYFITLEQWNEMVIDREEKEEVDGKEIYKEKGWYIFEDTRLVPSEVLGATNLAGAEISHTFRYLTSMPKDSMRFFGNKWVTYDGYLSDLNNNLIVKGKKFSITDRTEINISEEIDQYTTVYNNPSTDYLGYYFDDDNWIYNPATDSSYRVCSKLATRQIIPQLARNLVQNGINIQSVDGWSPMNYIESGEGAVTSGSVVLRTIGIEEDQLDIASSILYYSPPRKSLFYEWIDGNGKTYYSSGQSFYTKNDGENSFSFFCVKNDDTYKNNFTKGGTIQKVNYDNSNVQKILYLYPVIDSTGSRNITWSTVESNGESKKISVPIEDNHISVINFGIIGQEKKIEKGKIYCLGISCVSQSNDGIIKIGEGSLISEGDYNFVGEPIEFKLDELFNGVDYVKTDEGFWANIDEGKNAIELNKEELEQNRRFILFKAPKTIENPYFVIQSNEKILIHSVYFFEAYTKGIDSFSEAKYYKYSGRDLFGTECPDEIANDGKDWPNGISPVFTTEQIREMILFEDDIMLGSTYGYQQYYIQRLKTWNGNDVQEEYSYYDTMGQKEFISEKNIGENCLPLDAAKYTEDNYEVQTNYIDMNKCPNYCFKYKKTEILQDGTVEETNDCDCNYGDEDPENPTKICFYQKFGYCPYRFNTEKHCRRVRTLSVEKSNRFNILQEISKVFEMYPQFYIQHKSNGKVIKSGEEYDKQVFFITEKGTENKIGFRYEKNLKDIGREINSEQIVTKLYVLDVDSDLSKTGLCSIKTAEDNPSKDSYIIDLSYYIEKGQLDADEVEQDLWGTYPAEDGSELPSGFLRQLGYYNGEYDRITNNIINLQDASFNELEANLIVNLEGIVTAQEQLVKLKKQIDAYSALNKQTSLASQTYINYQTKYAEQQAILVQLIADTFFTNGAAAPDGDQCYFAEGIDQTADKNSDIPSIWFKCIASLDQVKKHWVDEHQYMYGILGQYNKEYLQIQAWKKERASYLKLINRISAAFYRKYEPYLKEGTWSDSNYLTDNAYYFGALDVAAEGAIPKVSYSTSVIDIAPLSEEWNDIYQFELGDITYAEDIGMFGVNQKTGLPNRLKVLVAELSDNLDDPSKNSIKVQNFTTQFEDLFQQVTASVQSLTFNENIYKRSSNFTALQNVSKDSLQGTLDSNDLTLLDTAENNIRVDNMGTRGSSINNHANKYKLDGQGLFFSNDGGEHWSVGVGPGGINADYINVGTLDAGRIRIVDNDYLYFSWDKNGIIAYRDPFSVSSNEVNANDAAIFNKYGLSIVQGGNIRLRAGYAYNGEDGLISAEQEQGDEVGFYLYDNAGRTIFSTTTNDQGANNSAKINLNGEFFATNTSSSVQGNLEYTYKNGYNFKSIDAYVACPSGYLFESIQYESNDDTITYTGTITSYGQDFLQNQAAAYAAYIYLKNKDNNNIQNIKINLSYNSVQTKETYKDMMIEKQSLTDKYAVFGISGNTYLFSLETIYKFTYKNEQNENKEIYLMEIKNSNKTFYGYVSLTSTVQLAHCLTESISGVSDVYNYQLSQQTISTYDLTKKIINSGIECYVFNGSQSLYIDSINKIVYKDKNNQSSIDADGQVALYINNTEDITNDSAVGNSRLFVCCVEQNDSNGNSTGIRNILSILKNGSLYIGGTVTNTGGQILYNVEELPNQISVDGAGIKISNNTLKIDFSNIQNDGGQGLDGYINEQLTGYTTYFHSHTINFSDPVAAYLSSGNILGNLPENASDEDKIKAIIEFFANHAVLLDYGSYPSFSTGYAQ